MGLDKANIFKLKEEVFSKYKKDPFLDCFESTKTFAKSLLRDIETKETPHSLLLSADYGMGKTFFSTRFTQYLRNKHYDVIYFSVWENDYLNEPFLAFSKEIIKYINDKFQFDKYKDLMADFFESVENVVNSLSLSFLGGALSISAKDLLDNFKKNDPITDFRIKLTKFIAKIPKKKLIIIIDELDRCRPDYAMKTLECIKHFFDIEGLFIIVPTNKNALNDCIKALYGIDNCNRKNSENYYQKFFNDERIIKKSEEKDYLFIIEQYLTEERLKEAFEKKLLSSNDYTYNSYSNLKKFYAYYSYRAKLTVRELKDFSIELARICNNFYEPIRVQWLACIMAYKNYDKDYNFKYPLEKEHCFYKEHYASSTKDNGKKAIVSLSAFVAHLKTIRSITNLRDDTGHYVNSLKLCNFINNYREIQNDKQNYKDIKNFFDNLSSDIKLIKTHYSNCTIAINILKTIEEKMNEQINLINQYQEKYGSDDYDDIREKNYQQIIDLPDVLYSIVNS